MSIQQFYYVLAVARYRHFETAADKCFVAQSTLSTMISKLEAELDLSIFDRSRKPVGITREGALLIDQIRLVISEINYLEEMVHEIKGQMKGTVRISCIPTVASFLFPFFFPAFSNSYPELKLELKESATEDIVRHLKKRETDIGIVSPPVNEGKELLLIPLYKESFTYYDTSEEEKAAIHINNIRLDNFWVLEEGHCMADQVMEICNSAGKNLNSALNITFKAGSIGSLIRFVKGNKGKTILPYMAAETLPETEKKYVIPFKPPVPCREIHFLVHPHYPKRNLLKVMEKELKDKIGRLDRGENLKPLSQKKS